MTRNRAIIITPWEPASNQLRETITRTLRESDIEVLEPRMSTSSLPYAITRGIESSDFVVADVSQQNPNVMYELGLAHGLKKPTILLVDRKSNAIPSDLVGSLFVVYDSEDPDSLQDTLRRRLRQFAQGPLVAS
ncbi:MAG: hypothetical protein ACRD3T_02890 [Terriglobia bacterium]